MEQLERLKDEHRRLTVLAGRLAWIIERDCPPPAQELYPLRQEFASAVICHLKLEDWLIYPQLMSSSDERVSQTATTFSKEMGGIGECFQRYSKRWNAIAINADWEGYRQETSTFLDALRNRIEREEADLYPLCSHLNAPLIQRAF